MSAKSDDDTLFNPAFLDFWKDKLAKKSVGSSVDEKHLLFVALNLLYNNQICGLTLIEVEAACIIAFFDQCGSRTGVCGVIIKYTQGKLAVALCDQNKKIVYSGLRRNDIVELYLSSDELRRALTDLVCLVSTYSQSPFEGLRNMVERPRYSMD